MPNTHSHYPGYLTPGRDVLAVGHYKHVTSSWRGRVLVCAHVTLYNARCR